MRAVNKDERKKNGEKVQLSDEELDKMIISRFECQQKCLDTQKKYYDKFKKILTVRQAEQLFKFGQPGFPGHMSRNTPKGPHMNKAYGKNPALRPQICPQRMEQPEQFIQSGFMREDISYPTGFTLCTFYKIKEVVPIGTTSDILNVYKVQLGRCQVVNHLRDFTIYIK